MNIVDVYFDKKYGGLVVAFEIINVEGCELGNLCDY